MAFTATIRNTQYYGAGRTSYTGDWSGSAGDAAGTMQIGGVVIQAIFQKMTNDGSYEVIPRVSSTASGGITTITVENQDNVTTGYFTIDKLG